MESWTFIYTACVIQVIYYLARYTKKSIDLISPSTVSAMTLLVWFYPKIPDLAMRSAFGAEYLWQFLIFLFLCQTGYFIGMNLKFSSKLKGREISFQKKENYNRWIIVLWIFSVIGGVAFYLYSGLPPEMLYMRQPSGIVTVLLFFSVFLTIATIIAALLVTRIRHWLVFLPLSLGILLYADRIIVHGQRSELFEIFFLSGVVGIICLRRRVRILTAILAGFLMITFNAVVSDYRDVMKKERRDIGELSSIPIGDRIRNSMFTADHDIINSLAFFVAYSSPSRPYRFGSDYWNGIIHRYVPGQFVGRNLKNSLMLKNDNVLWDDLRYSMPLGTTVFSAGGVFRNFGWFSPIFFFLYGSFLGFIFQRALGQSLVHLVMYTYFGALIPVVLIFGLQWFTTLAVFWIPVFYFIRIFVKKDTLVLERRLGASHVTS